MREIAIDRSHQGPFGTANGGYVAGILGDALDDEPTTARIHKPVPVDTPLHILRDDDTAVIRHRDETIASAEIMRGEIPATWFVPMEEALGATDPQLDMGMFAACFVCGQDTPDGLGVKPKALADGRFAAVWRPWKSRHIEGPVVETTYLRSALDCPGGFAALTANQTLAVTGTLTTQVYFNPPSEEPLIVVGEATHAEGRKLGAVSTIFTESDEIVATASALWIALAPADQAVA